MSDYRTLKLALLADTSKFTTGLNKAQTQTKTLGSKLDGFAKGASRAMGIAATAVAGFAAALAVDSVKAYSDFAETSSKVDVIFGKQADTIKTWAEGAAKAFGQSRTQAMDAASEFATFGKAAGLSDKKVVKFSKKLTILASDLASFNNTTPEEAITAIGAALRGESEPIRKYGVLLNDATLKNRAMKMGLYEGKGVLDQSAKVMAAYGEILAQTTDAQGDFTRTSDGVANGQRTLTALWDDAQLIIGEKLYPVVQNLVNYLTSDKGQKVITDFAQGFSNAMTIVGDALPGIFSNLKKIGKTAGNLGISWNDLANPKLAAAAAAFKLAPGGLQGKVIAALVAYNAAEALENMPGEDANAWDWIKWGTNPIRETLDPTGRPKDWAVDWLKNKNGIDPLNRPKFKSPKRQKKNTTFDPFGGGSWNTPKFKMDSDRLTPNINIVVNGAADSRESARAIERTLKKLQLNGGTLKGIEGFN